MITDKPRYRIKLRGAFPHVTPHHEDIYSHSPREVVRFALQMVIASSRAGDNGPGFSAFTICHVTKRGAEGPVLIEWVAGE